MEDRQAGVMWPGALIRSPGASSLPNNSGALTCQRQHPATQQSGAEWGTLGEWFAGAGHTQTRINWRAQQAATVMEKCHQELDGGYG